MYKLSTAKQILGLIGWLVITFIAAAVGAWGSLDAASFYQTLALPHWAPPAQIFAPVWSFLYFLMAIAAWLVWKERGWHNTDPTPALGLYFFQLAVNAAWSWSFFEWKLGVLSFGIILMLWLLIVLTFLKFIRINTLASVLLLPYLAWVSFAAVLNFVVWQMNPNVL